MSFPVNSTLNFCDSSPKRKKLFSSPKHSSNQPNWSTLEIELLELILSKLLFIDILHFKATCSSWRSIAKLFISSSPLCKLPQTPWLMLPSSQHKDNSHCFLNLKDKTLQIMKNSNFKLNDDSYCVGSSHGWLVVFDKDSNIFIVNPFTKVKIKFPSNYDVLLLSCYNRYFAKESRRNIINKAIILSASSHSDDFILVAIFNVYSRIGFCKNGDTSWSQLQCTNNNQYFYCDIMSLNNCLYVLTENGFIEIWKFENSGGGPTKQSNIEPLPSPKMAVAREYYKELHSTRCYLIDMFGEIFIVTRFIGNFVNEEGKALDEAELLSEEDTHPLICPYKTLMFHVYKLDSDQCKWVEVENLNVDHVMFIGGNNSISLSASEFPEFHGNSIYFTDDNWEQMDEDYLYGGHDFGVFNLEKKRVESFYDCDTSRVEPPPFWVVPSPW